MIKKFKKEKREEKFLNFVIMAIYLLDKVKT